MANTGNIQVNIQTVENGQAAISANGNNTATTTFAECVEAVVSVVCTAVAGAGIFVPVLAGSVDGGTNYVALVPTSGSAMAAVSAVGTVNYRFKQLPPKLRIQWTKTSGTSITATIVVTGLVPVDSANATAV